MNVKTFKLKDFQDQFIFSEKRFPAFIGGIGTGKSLGLILKSVRICEDYPDSLVLIVRKEFVDLKDSTMKDFTTYTGIKIGVNKEVHFPNGSILMFRHGAELNILRNINLTAFGIEQADEFETDEQFTFLRDRLRRQNAPIRQGFVIGNVNGHNWIWELWKKKPTDEFELSEANTFDNAENLPLDFIEDLKRMKLQMPAHYNRFVMNDWEEEAAGNWVIPVNLIEAALKIHFHAPGEKRIITCDPSMGGDKCVAYAMVNTGIVEEKIFPKGMRDTMRLAGELVIMKRMNRASLIVLDSIGIGQGICDRLLELGHRVLPVNSATKSKGDQFYNLRAEMWWHTANMFIDHKVSFGNVDKIDFNTLKKQLSSVQYEVIKSSGLTKLVNKIESKDKIKGRLGNSPDHADAYVMGVYGLQFAKTQEEIKKKKDPYAYEEPPKSTGFMGA